MSEYQLEPTRYQQYEASIRRDWADQHGHDVANMTADERNDYDKHLADLDQRVRAIGFVLSMVREGLAR